MTDVTKDMAEAGDKPEQNRNRNGLIHLLSLSASKTADALIDPKLVLSWLMGAIGAPAYLIGALVPVREAGALLPQLWVARRVQTQLGRKRFWAMGAAVQSAMAVSIALIAYFLSDALAGWLIVAALAVLAIGRSIASTTYKDALAHSVPQGRRGAVTGAAGSIAAAFGLAYGVSMSLGVFGDVSITAVAAYVFLAGMLYGAAALVFLRLQEDDIPETREEAQSWRAFFAPLVTDRAFQLFILTRGFLTATAFAPPFIVMVTVGASERSLTQLGPLVVASALAASSSAFLWGKVSDISSRLTLCMSGLVAAGAYGLTAAMVLGGGTLGLWWAVGLMFVAQVAYQGVRSGRSIFLTDMTRDETRLRYTALSNTVIGIVLFAGLGLGGVAQLAGAEYALVICAIMAALGASFATRLTPLKD
ncbi:MFS transporter [Aliiroseovarius zhejiangensis]|uniref:MFS transporter n=1 Tax=Aliiroseovarius zhejiangensis TaxID=1632025 RepID=UPI00174E67CA|nr:MFS transporter [Aliiroseovarius zhejiangensis]